VGIRLDEYLCRRKSRNRTPTSAFTPVYHNWKDLSAEATIKALGKSTGLKLEFWVETPSRKFEEQAKMNIKELSAGEEVRYSAEFTPKETGKLHYTRVFIRCMEKNRSQDKYHLCAERAIYLLATSYVSSHA
jgi:hypothetical protein